MGSYRCWTETNGELCMKEDNVCCKIFGIVSRTDTCTNCSYKDSDGNNECKNITKEWRF